MHRYTGTARTLDIRIGSNRTAVGLVFVAGAIALFDRNALTNVVSVGGSTFLGWALGREFDPDKTLTAFLAGAGSAVIALTVGSAGHPVGLGAVYLILVASRITVRTTGRPPTQFDLAAHVGIAAWLVTGPLAWISALILALAVVGDTRVYPRAPARNVWWGMGMVGVVALVAVSASSPLAWEAPTITLWATVIAGLLGATASARAEAVTSTGDYRHTPIEATRLVAARIVALMGATVTALLGGAAGIGMLIPVWGALAAAGLARLVIKPGERLVGRYPVSPDP